MKAIKYILICFLVIFLISGCAKKEVAPVKESPSGLQTEADISKVTPEETSAPAVNIAEVSLMSSKTMKPDFVEIKKGMTVRFVNKEENYYHNIVIYPATIQIPSTKDVIAQSGNIKPGESWDYTVKDSGEYIVKDIYSGTMRGKITADVTEEILVNTLKNGKVIGRIYMD